MENAHALVAMLAKHYENEPDDYVVSVGHWVYRPQPYAAGVVVLPEFVADIRLTAGELRDLAAKS